MPFYFTPYVILPLLSAFVNASLALFSLRRRHVPAARPLFWLMVGMSGWSLSYALNTAATELSLKIFFLKTGIIFVCIVVPSMLVLAFETVGLGTWLTRRRLLLLCVIPIISVLLLWTSGLHNLHVYDFFLYTSGSLLLLGYKMGPFFVLHYAYARFITLITIVLFALGLWRMPRSEWFRFALLIMATMIPLTVNSLSKIPGVSFNFSTSTLFFSGTFYVVAVFRHRLLDLMPLARTVLFDQVGEPVLVFNGQGELVDCNHAAQRLFGNGVNADIAQMREAVFARFPSLQATPGRGLDCLPEEYVQDTGDSRGFWRVTSSAFNAGAIGGTLIVLHDISDLVITGQQLVESQQHLRDLNNNLQRKVEEETKRRVTQERLLANHSRLAAMGEMISAIAHQWRQPLSTLGMIVQRTHAMASMQGLTPEYLNEFKANAMRQVKYMSDTIEEFRGFYRPDKQKEPFSPHTCITDAVRLFEPQFTGNSIVVEVHCRPEDDLLAYGYPNEFKQVILNLLGNARDAILESRIGQELPKEGYISVGISNTGANTMVIDISDTGCGIPVDITSKIFDPYFTTKEESGGTGIGLYMSRMIMEDSLGGHLSLAQGQEGAIFRLELPLEEQK